MKKFPLNSLELSILISFVIFLPITSFALNKTDTLKNKYINMKFVVSDRTLLKGSNVDFQVCKANINSEFISDVSFYAIDIGSLVTNFKLPLNTEVNYIRMTFNSPFWRKGQGFLNGITNIFICEKGDSITVHLTKTSVRFEGKGSDKYNCIYKLASQNRDAVAMLPKILDERPLVEQILEKENKVEDSLYAAKKNILNHYKNLIEPSVFSLINADIWAEYNEHLIYMFLTKTDNSGLRNPSDSIISKRYDNYLKNFNSNKFEISVLVNSFKYCDFLYKKERFSTMFLISSKPGALNFKYTFEELFDFINRDSNDILYDKLILISFNIEINFRSDAPSVISRAMNKMAQNGFYKALEELKMKSTGMAYPFKLPDSTGKVHNLADYKDKILILDFWYTGCLACANLAKELKPIIKSYKSQPNVMFMTINIDSKKETWIRSLATDKYSSDDEVNLYTGGLGKQHPIIKYYNIQGYPVLIIIKNGKVISTSPPRPNRDDPKSSQIFIDFLNKNL